MIWSKKQFQVYLCSLKYSAFVFRSPLTSLFFVFSTFIAFEASLSWILLKRAMSDEVLNLNWTLRAPALKSSLNQPLGYGEEEDALPGSAADEYYTGSTYTHGLSFKNSKSCIYIVSSSKTLLVAPIMNTTLLIFISTISVSKYIHLHRLTYCDSWFVVLIPSRHSALFAGFHVYWQTSRKTHPG